MSKNRKSLPKPPKTPFGIRKYSEVGTKKEPLLADQMAQAVSRGDLEEYLKNEFSDNEHSRQLAKMMMGMMGLISPEDFSVQSEESEDKVKKKKSCRKASVPPLLPPRDVLHAAQAGDMEGLIGLLKREHSGRALKADRASVKTVKKRQAKTNQKAVITQHLIDQFLEIASDNNVSADWLLFRAVTQYVKDYQKTGKL
jgi:hypothetical protein